jgi:hypothetical protein
LVTPFVVTSEEERKAALERIELLSQFPPGAPEALERFALIEAVKAFEDARTAAQFDQDDQF